MDKGPGEVLELEESPHLTMLAVRLVSSHLNRERKKKNSVVYKLLTLWVATQSVIAAQTQMLIQLLSNIIGWKVVLDDMTVFKRLFIFYIKKSDH